MMSVWEDPMVQLPLRGMSMLRPLISIVDQKCALKSCLWAILTEVFAQLRFPLPRNV